jgi:hypothetical protein
MIGDLPVIKISGYFNDAAVKRVYDMVKQFLSENQGRFIFDFSGCSLINSPGMSGFAELVYLIIDDYSGKAVFCGLDKLKLSLFSMTGLVPANPSVPTIEDARALLGE